MSSKETGPRRFASMRRGERGALLRFWLDGEEFTTHPGDTVASALLAAGRIRCGDSIYRGRPRGIFTADSAEPNAFVQILGAQGEPSMPATTLDVADGMQLRTLSGVGWLETDTAASTVDSPALRAHPNGSGIPGDQEQLSRSHKKYVHTDVLVVGGGRAGLAAAEEAARDGSRVMLVDQGTELGGRLLDLSEAEQLHGARIQGRNKREWLDELVSQLHANPRVRALRRATAVGCYDHGYALVSEQIPGGGLNPRTHQRLWHVRAKRIVLATGSAERPIVFENNDRPGIMLASAVRTYLNRYGVLVGQRAVLFTTNDSAYAVARELSAAGAEVAALVDARPSPPADLVESLLEAGITVHSGSAVVDTTGEEQLDDVRVAPLNDHGDIDRESVVDIPCDLLAVSGGWSPNLALFSQLGGKLRWDADSAAMQPVDPGEHGLPTVVGSASGGSSRAHPEHTRQYPLWMVPSAHVQQVSDPGAWRNHFVDLQRDSTVADVFRAVGAGMRSVEHVKRYTTIGTGSDQGKTSALNVMGVLNEALTAHGVSRSDLNEIGTTSFRPPTVPVPIQVLAGRDRGQLHDPVRTTPMHSWLVAHGAEFEDVGQWKRAWYFPQPGESMEQAVLRECAAARESVAMMDASTLGKIEIIGPDAGEFLNRIYTNGFKKLAIGKGRYGVMCKADGMVFDDGVTMRLAEDRYLMSTTTGNAATVLDWLEEWLQTEWPELGVYCTSVTEQWATVAVVGPDSREVISRLAPNLDVSNEAFQFMEFRDTVLSSGIPARICRISFSGELAYEINVESWYGLAVWEAVYQAGQDFGITPYGTETMHVLRAEKGFIIVGQDTDGTVTPHDLGMDWVVSQRKDFIGKRSFSRPDTARADRKQLVGLLPVNPTVKLPEGAQLVEPAAAAHFRAAGATPVPMLGHVTSSYRSSALQRTFALALVKSGQDRMGERVVAPVNGHDIEVEIASPVFYDPEGARRDGR